MRMHALCAPLALATGCLMAGNYHTAKTLDKGLSQTGLTFSATRYEKTQTDGNGNTTTVAAAIPNILPELTYHLGVADNLEAGGRVSLGALGGELDLKYRFLHNDKLHLAVAPAVSYQAFVVIEGVGVRLPGILTYELSDMLDFNAAAFVSQSHWTTAGSNSSDFSTFKGDLTATGAAIGFDLHGETLSIRPSVEFTRYVANVGNSGTFDPFNTVNFLVHIAWTGGREKQQLNRIEDKIDRLSPAPAPYAPAPAPAPYAPAPAPAPYPPAPAPAPDAPPPM